jgi:hypothetical protein
MCLAFQDFIPWQSVGCVTSLTYYSRYLTITLVPMGLVLMLCLLFLLPLWRASKRSKMEDEAKKLAIQRTWQKFWFVFLSLL